MLAGGNGVTLAGGIQLLCRFIEVMAVAKNV